MSLEDRIVDNGYEDVIIFKDFDYDSAFIGISDDNRAIYDYDKMVEWLIDNEGMTEENAMEWIDYNTLRALHYMGDKCPIIMYSLI